MQSIMKKEYINPETVVIDLKVSQSLLAGSPDAAGEYKSGDPVLSSEFQDNGGSEDW